MAHNIGEEITGQYLKICRNCDFVEYNLYTTEVQGEIDVVGIDMKNKKVFICEVAVHLGGLQYTKNGQPDNYDRFMKKFEKDIVYANNRFDDSYEKIYMLWSPVVRNSKEGSKHNQVKDVQRVKEDLKNRHNIDLQLIINKSFLDCLDELREYAGRQTEELKSPILRFMQIEYRLGIHVTKELVKNRQVQSLN
ncbi:hypothetical protein [Rufibacter ruber]|uniref:hypothetical protein n=1 Tax=Rufibacter ruber TaxID=1783499 RepID=UPI00082E19BD|nr:hypothetical protein [Rufibacter ruber]